ncbi:unnamed protein product [Adineta steineri]|uniref:SET domain-containing protein n=1 Tax=Adineta steineri TaxID=433720 RepID=A0A819MK15_9BILA|nr:unnamed protein product [Adineta steineri]
MPFTKKAEVQNLPEKYGSGKHKGIVALEKITKGEIIFKCDTDKCPYYPFLESQNNYTKEELNKLVQQYPDSRDYIYSYIYTIDDNTYQVAKDFLSKVVPEECALFNHSCTPNVGYGNDVLTLHVALRDIELGEELTVHYGFFEGDNSLYNGLNCKCGSSNCSKILHFDFYKSPEFQDQYYKYCSKFIRSKIQKLRPDIES